MSDGYIRDLLRRLRDEGWTVGPVRGSGHLELRTPDGVLVVLSSTPSDRRAMRNVEKTLRAYGFDTVRVHRPKHKRPSGGG